MTVAVHHHCTPPASEPDVWICGCARTWVRSAGGGWRTVTTTANNLDVELRLQHLAFGEDPRPLPPLPPEAD